MVRKEPLNIFHQEKKLTCLHMPIDSDTMAGQKNYDTMVEQRIMRQHRLVCISIQKSQRKEMENKGANRLRSFVADHETSST